MDLNPEMEVFSATNNNNTVELFEALLVAFNTMNRGDIKGDIKSDIKKEFESVVAPYIEERLAGAFISRIIGSNMMTLFRAPAMNPDIIHDNDFIGSADQSLF